MHLEVAKYLAKVVLYSYVGLCLGSGISPRQSEIVSTGSRNDVKLP